MAELEEPVVPVAGVASIAKIPHEQESDDDSTHSMDQIQANGEATVEGGALKSEGDGEDEEEEGEELSSREAYLKGLLKRMGFPDEREIMAAIRHCLEIDEAATSEQVSVWIIQQREEAEESRKMDLARARSETLREEAKKRREETRKRRILESSCQEWKTSGDLFLGSVVLDSLHPARISMLRESDGELFASFLGLEKKTLNWFGNDLPWCYLRQVAAELDAKSYGVNAYLTQTIRIMQESMSSLSQYEDNKPKLFMAAKATAFKNGLPLGPDGEDDEVQVIDAPLGHAKVGKADDDDNEAETVRKGAPLGPDATLGDDDSDDEVQIMEAPDQDCRKDAMAGATEEGLPSAAVAALRRDDDTDDEVQTFDATHHDDDRETMAGSLVKGLSLGSGETLGGDENSDGEVEIVEAPDEKSDDDVQVAEAPLNNSDNEAEVVKKGSLLLGPDATLAEEDDSDDEVQTFDAPHHEQVEEVDDRVMVVDQRPEPRRSVRRKNGDETEFVDASLSKRKSDSTLGSRPAKLRKRIEVVDIVDD